MAIENPHITDPGEYLLYLLKLHIDYAASDSYFTFNEEPSLRVNDEVYRLVGLDKFSDEMLDAIAQQLMDERDKELFEKNMSVDIGYVAHNRRFRINISQQSGHRMIVFRLFAEKVPTLDDLKLSPVFKQLMQKTSGIIFIAGPTGSGKSTTLAAMIEEINMNKQKHIITLEDPIEYIFTPKKALIEQKQLGKDIASFSSAMKYALRQRPDVILFGEARDPDGIRNAIALAETGHLVLTTIHSRSAAQTVNKIISMFPADEQSQIRNQISDTMAAIIVQKLAKRVGGGMVPVQEILLNNTAVENIIRENKLNQLNNTIYTNRAMGMQLLEDHLLFLASKGFIDLNNAVNIANDSDYLIKELAAKGLIQNPQG
ncbi:MAG: PilT/PilU family type 4a pilus ATPase [Candidatus Absconditabacteria bacterium]|nr:PilT/PilU family type 4a pilus ATPase [Candidatus Absconditabacteria bacterium]MDD3868077.1 PilT/PilU family type 4a pilus ATPase [Candidatus Absconditabacteria bacterium]MDD4714324.1 PilT/PilU family type 4a pilus ATPase [Candidatus Absconditabacteria bacterium]